MKQRIYSMDLIRVIAMVLVIIVHTKGNFFSADVHSAVYAFFKVAGTIGVPLFVMLTGYLMFGRNHNDNSYLQKYLSRNLLPLVIAYEVWNIVWNLLRYTHAAENPQKWSAIIKAGLFMGDTMSALWYLHDHRLVSGHATPSHRISQHLIHHLSKGASSSFGIERYPDSIRCTSPHPDWPSRKYPFRPANEHLRCIGLGRKRLDDLSTGRICDP